MPSRSVTTRSSHANAPSRPASSIASTGMMRDEDAGEQFRDLADRLPGEAVGFAVLVGREPERGERDRRSARRRARSSAARPWCRRCRTRCRASMPRDSRIAAMTSAISTKLMPPRSAMRAGALGLRGVSRAGRTRCRAPRNRQHQHRRRCSVCSHRCCAVQKNRRRAGNRRTAADRRAGVSAPPTLATRMMKNTTICALCGRAVVGADQRPDQDHRRAGGADEARDQRPDRKHRRVDQRACRAGCR